MCVNDPKQQHNTTMLQYSDTTKKDVNAKAKNAVKYDLSDLINPSDVQESSDSWEDIDEETIEKECYESASIMLSERQEPFYGLVRDYAIIRWRDSMNRVNMDSDFVSDDVSRREAMTVYGKWPFDMNYNEAFQILDEYVSETNVHQIPHSVWQDSQTIVERGIVAGLKPKGIDN